MEFFSRVFTWLANLSSKLPQIDLKSYFIVVLAVIAGVGLVVGLTFFGTKAHKLKAACKKITKYLGGVDSIDDDNVGDFTSVCFSAKAPQSLRDMWVEYLGVRFGFPSDILSEKNVYDKEVKKVKETRANLYIGIALILVAIFAFWGFGTLSAIEMSVIHCAGLLLAAVVYLVLVFLNRKQIKTTREAFYEMQDDLDAKVNLQVEKNFATDSSPLVELAAMVDEIIARNTEKEITLDEDEQEITPIETLIDEMEGERLVEEAVQEEVKEEPAIEEKVEEPAPQEEVVEEQKDEPQEEPIEETFEEPFDEPIEEPLEEVEKQPEEELPEEPKETIEEKHEPMALKESIAAARMAGYTAFNKKFFGEYLKQKYGENVEVNERENKTSTGLPLADTYFALDGSARKCFVYAYEIDGSTLLLCNADSEFEENVKERHENINLSAFPKSKDEWYSLPIDDTYTGDELKGILDYCYAHALGKELVKEEPQEEPAPVVEQPEVVEEPVAEPVEETVEPEEPVEEIVEEVEQQPEEPAEEVAEEVTEEESEEPQTEEPEEAQEDSEEGEEIPFDEENDEETPEEKQDEGEEDEEKVVYVVDEEEEEDFVQPARLAKLSNLTDYMLSQNMSKKVKMQVAGMLIGVYGKFKDSPEDKKIIVDCLKKVIFSLQQREQEPVEYVEEPEYEEYEEEQDEQESLEGSGIIENEEVEEDETDENGVPFYNWKL